MLSSVLFELEYDCHTCATAVAVADLNRAAVHLDDLA